MRKPSADYPIGRSRLETVSASLRCLHILTTCSSFHIQIITFLHVQVGVIGCAVIMAVSSFEVMRASLGTLIEFWKHGTFQVSCAELMWPFVNLCWLT